MENFTIKSMYLKLCNEFRAVVRCTNAAFYKPDYEKLWAFETLNRAFQTLGRAFKTIGRASEYLREN